MPKRMVPSYTLGAWMKKRVSRVALPRVRTRRPVASGSSVPVWPTRFWRRMRRTFCTASCDVIPGSLSTRSSPCCMVVPSAREGSGELAGDLLAQGAELTVGGEAGGVLVAAAAVVAGELLDVDVAAAAQRHLVAVTADLAEQRHR